MGLSRRAYARHRGVAENAVRKAIASGRIRTRESVDQGLDSMPAAFLKLFSGENFGKMLVKV